jgi:hypothetical protein
MSQGCGTHEVVLAQKKSSLASTQIFQSPHLKAVFSKKEEVPRALGLHNQVREQNPRHGLAKGEKAAISQLLLDSFGFDAQTILK